MERTVAPGLDTLPDPERSLLKIKLTGIVEPSQLAAIEALRERVAARGDVLAKIEAASLVLAPEDDAWERALPPGAARRRRAARPRRRIARRDGRAREALPLRPRSERGARVILERLAVSGFRSYANPFVFEPGERLTVVHAPNGTGKSTLIEALYCGLLERHTASNERTKARMLPTGRELTPDIEIAIAANGERYRVRKTFLARGGSSALVERFERGAYVRLHQSHAADDFLRELLCADAAHGGVRKAEHFGLAHVLWSPSQSEFGELPAQAGERVRSLLGASAVAVTQGERDIRERVAAEFQRYWVAKGGRYATGAGAENVPELERAVAAAREAAVDAQTQYGRLAILERDYEDRRAELLRLDARRSGARTDIAAARSAVAKRRELEAASERARYAETGARSAYDRAEAERIELERLTRERGEQAIAHVSARTDAERAERDGTDVDGRLRAARAAFEDAQARLGAVRARASLATAAETYVAARSRLAELAAVLDAHDALRRERDIARAEAMSAAAPSRRRDRRVPRAARRNRGRRGDDRRLRAIDRDRRLGRRHGRRRRRRPRRAGRPRSRFDDDDRLGRHVGRRRRARARPAARARLGRRGEGPQDARAARRRPRCAARAVRHGRDRRARRAA